MGAVVHVKKTILCICLPELVRASLTLVCLHWTYKYVRTYVPEFSRRRFAILVSCGDFGAVLWGLRCSSSPRILFKLQIIDHCFRWHFTLDTAVFSCGLYICMGLHAFTNTISKRGVSSTRFSSIHS